MMMSTTLASFLGALFVHTNAAPQVPWTSYPLTETNSSQPFVVDATYDGKCFYPKPVPDFDLDGYLGRWYQVAGTVAPFTVGCTCIHADYSLNNNGTVDVINACERNGQASAIQGTATPIPSKAGYGKAGVLRVQFPRQSASECAGPNYVVQDLGPEYPSIKGSGADASFAIVQTANFTTLFLLSRQRNPANASVEAWLEKARNLGSDLSEVVWTDQSNCTSS